MKLLEDIKQIISEEKFVSMVNESMKISIVNGKLNAKFGIFQKEDIKEEYVESMNELWEDFKEGYVNYVMNKVCK